MHPTAQEIAFIYQQYKQIFCFDDNGSIDPYFQHNVSLENCWIKKEANQIVSSLCAHTHHMHFHDSSLPVIFINGVFTLEAYRHKGYVRQLFHELFQDTMAQTALYVLQAYHPEIYTSMGFIGHYAIRHLTYQGEKLPYQLTSVTSPRELSACASKALQHMEGWMDHDISFYQAQLIEAKAQQHNISGIYQDHTLIAFVRYAQKEQEIDVEEICAVNETAAHRLLAQLASLAPIVHYPVPASKKDADASLNLMVKLGNQTLCSQCLHKEIHSTYDIYHDDQKYYHYGWW